MCSMPGHVAVYSVVLGFLLGVVTVHPVVLALAILDARVYELAYYIFKAVGTGVSIFLNWRDE